MSSVDALGIIHNPVNTAAAVLDITLAVLFIFKTFFVILTSLSVLPTTYKLA